MAYIKQYWKHDGYYRALIRTNTYCKNLKHILMMALEAMKDYKEVSIKDITVVVYGGDRIKGMMGLEFPIEEPNLDYKQISKPEYILG